MCHALETDLCSNFAFSTANSSWSGSNSLVPAFLVRESYESERLVLAGHLYIGNFSVATESSVEGFSARIAFPDTLKVKPLT